MSADPVTVPQEVPASRGFGGSRGRALLSLVPPPVRARRAPFVALLLVLLAAGLVGLLLLNTASAQDAFRLHSLQSQQALLDRQRQQYASREDGLDDPARLAYRASVLGLVPGGVPVFLAKGQPLPKGGIRLGDIVYVPGAVPVVTAPPAPKPTPTAAKKVVLKPVTKAPATVRRPTTGRLPAKAPTTTAVPPKTVVPPKTTVPPRTVTRTPATGTTTGTAGTTTAKQPTTGGH